MGCGSSSEQKTESGKSSSNPLIPPPASSLLGKDKYIGDSGAVVMAPGGKSAAQNVIVASVPPSGLGLQFALRNANGDLFVKEFLDDAQLEAEKTAASLETPWHVFFKSIASDLLKLKAKTKLTSSSAVVTFSIGKDDQVKPFAISLLPSQDPVTDLHRLFLTPMVGMVQKKRNQSGDHKDKEQRLSESETKIRTWDVAVASHTRIVASKKDVVPQLRETAAPIIRSNYPADLNVIVKGRCLDEIRVNRQKHPIDRIQEEGGACYFRHLREGTVHFPKAPDGQRMEFFQSLISHVLPSQVKKMSHLSRCIEDPQLQKIVRLSGGSQDVAEGILRALQKLDDWDYNVFALEQASNGNALFCTTIAILCKLDLVARFNLNLETLRNFIAAVQSGYHTNPYHNATHAADVTHINYYILTQGGLREKCNLSNEELLAAVLAGAIHDYDHPGFNNNFHTKTNAYLSTLYNDRSVLENHHLACVYEILRLPKFNIFAAMTDDQRSTIRATMIEMVLATDMGNHQKIFTQFRNRIAESPSWHSSKDDIRLALSMGIKMADVSNCGRPTSLYRLWAKRIAAEFYNQGDAEDALGIPISPFMDRLREAQDFPKGQVSFMNFVVVPMFQSVATFLPHLEFCVDHCTTNREFWERND